uniref:Neur_chan_memb domain-containing protein n=1 Tax=Heterorhabditis bacteriophora TaxID=37862 RepID=A0A1I7X6S0_HETBA
MESLESIRQDRHFSIFLKTKVRQRRERLAKRIDTLSAILFPSLFSLFNIAYWSHYLRSDGYMTTMSEEIKEEN